MDVTLLKNNDVDYILFTKERGKRVQAVFIHDSASFVNVLHIFDTLEYIHHKDYFLSSLKMFLVKKMINICCEWVPILFL